jgi:hypothetical protein
MPFLIDGHNVIAALPDIELDDPHDEAKLVLKLRAWAGRGRCKATVVFDGGVPGGYSRQLSGGGLEVVFASRRHTDADSIIRARLRHLRDGPNWTVVSSDHEVLNAARRAGARTLTAQAFVQALAPAPRLNLGKPKDVSPDEVSRWLEVFGSAEDALEAQAPEARPPTRKRPPARSSAPSHGERSLGEQVGWEPATEPSPASADVERRPRGEKPEDVSADEVEAWLEVFGDVAAEAPPPELPKRSQRRELAVDKHNPDALSKGEVEDWLTVFERKERREREVRDAPPRRDAPQVERSKTLSEKKAQQSGGFEGKAEGLSEEDLDMWYRLFGEEPEDNE